MASDAADGKWDFEESRHPIERRFEGEGSLCSTLLLCIFHVKTRITTAEGEIDFDDQTGPMRAFNSVLACAPCHLR